MKFIIFLFILVLLMVAVSIWGSNGEAQKTCEQDHSFDVCFQSLN